MAPALGWGVRQEALEQAQVWGALWPPLSSLPLPRPASSLPAKKTAPVLFNFKCTPGTLKYLCQNVDSDWVAQRSRPQDFAFLQSS